MDWRQPVCHPRSGTLARLFRVYSLPTPFFNRIPFRISLPISLTAANKVRGKSIDFCEGGLENSRQHPEARKVLCSISSNSSTAFRVGKYQRWKNCLHRPNLPNPLPSPPPRAPPPALPSPLAPPFAILPLTLSKPTSVNI